MNFNESLFKKVKDGLQEKIKKLSLDDISFLKNGGKTVRLSKRGGKNKIKIKKANRGKFTEYCNGKVTSECIAKGKRSPNPVIRKRATFAANARKWKK